jgi:uncharacterized protein
VSGGGAFSRNHNGLPKLTASYRLTPFAPGAFRPLARRKDEQPIFRADLPSVIVKSDSIVTGETQSTDDRQSAGPSPLTVRRGPGRIGPSKQERGCHVSLNPGEGPPRQWCRQRGPIPMSPRRLLGFRNALVRLNGAFPGLQTMDISRAEQRILHLLAQGGRIEIARDDRGDIEELACYSRDGWLYTDFNLILFRKLKQKRAIASRNSKPYRITPRGLELVRSQPDNR